MYNKISRRNFLIKTTAATAAVYALDQHFIYGEQAGAATLQSTLSPSRSGALVNVARNRVVYQSSSADDDHTGHLTTDGSPLTYWESRPDGEQWIAIDLGEVLPVSRLTVHWGKSFARNYRIEVSSENSKTEHWTTVHTADKVNGDVENIALKSISARHIRLVGISDTADRGFSIAEFEAWGVKKPHPAPAPQVLAKSGTLLSSGWSLQSTTFATSTAENISSPKFTGTDWLPAIVPGTVLASYLADDAIPDPFYGNQQTEISEEFFTRNDFWYRNSFVISSACKGRRLWLVFEGINWKAEVYLNGAKLGDIVGSFIRTRFDITKVAVCGGTNCVAVLIRKVAHPGEIEHKKLGGKYQNGGILGLDSPTFVSSIGWNWVPTIPGRNIGIWNDVRFETSGDAVLADPWVTSELPSPDNSKADLTVRTDVTNASDQPRRCTLVLSMGDIAFRKEISLQPHETQSVAIDKAECGALAMEHPQLWWPNGYGEPTLHTMKLQIESDGNVSDEKSVTFGIRTVDYRDENGILNIYVNGHRILCRGGNWGMEDGMLVCDKEGYDLRVRMHRDMNLVMIRNWVGMVGRDAFYEACDRYGILIWDDFWLANPGDGPDPSDHEMFMTNVLDKVRRVRHHASLALYCGRNEGHPPPDLDAGMRDAVSKLDGTRYYISASDSGLVTGHGPYDNQDPEWYFKNRGATFHTEQGIVCVPPVESMRAMMPEKDLWPISDTWAVHDYQDPRSVLYTARIGHRYGKPTGIEDYCRKSQMVNMESAKAIFECLMSRQGSGQLMWMTQAAWPALICQLYDYYFEQTAAYFGTKTACEPLHILWDQNSDIIKVANSTIADRRDLQADAWIYDIDGREQWHKTITLSVSSTSARDCFHLDMPAKLSRVFFVKLKLSGADKTLSENFYWHSTESGDCTDLNTLPEVSLPASAHIATDGTTRIVTASISNPASTVALAIRLKVVRGSASERVLPAMYADNYFSLLPHESKIVKISFPAAALAGETPRLAIEGWNIRMNEIHIG
jgi:Exo-beta-D-glucosaminidase Ig-fold domain/F5/8 type C domain/Glycosyl hydrolases family 2/Glycosyl hydrolases family 2, sugar binding domain